MKRMLVGIGFLLTTGSFAVAGPFEDGMAAYKRGDVATAVKLMREAAKQGDAAAQFNLGISYQNGEGVTRDYVEAAKWYRMAAEHGNVYAQANLGIAYFNGHGVPQDYILAHMWLNLAAARGDSSVAESRDLVAKRMTGDQIAEAQRLAREWQPSK